MIDTTGMMRRAVFSELQRRGLERRFQIQKYISKPERKKLAEKLGLKDSQVGEINQFNSFSTEKLEMETAEPIKKRELASSHEDEKMAAASMAWGPLKKKRINHIHTDINMEGKLVLLLT